MFGIVYGSDSDNKIMNRFVDEYELWCNEGKNPDIAREHDAMGEL